jgi:RNA polymerase primary sigma factor
MDKTSRTYYANNESLTKYFGEISNIPLLTSEEEVRLATEIREGNKRALTQLIQGNLRFVVRVALEYKNQGLPLEDLINEGNLGLIKAAKRFDETKGFKFISYAVWWIRQCILQSLAEQTRTVRLPLNRITTINRVGKTHDSLEQIFEREPTQEEIAESLDLTLGEINFISQLPGKQLSFDASISSDEKTSLLEITGDDSLLLPDQQVTDESLKEEIEKALETLSKNEADILRLYFGFDRERPATLEEIGKKFHITRERVRQIKEKAIIRLRHKSRSRHLKQFIDL